MASPCGACLFEHGGLDWGIWWKIDGKVNAARTEAAAAAATASAVAALAREELAAHKLYTAEHYVSKAGLRETRSTPGSRHNRREFIANRCSGTFVQTEPMMAAGF
ncbi:hypothetical protein J2W42_006479 [Rhizobium tibeticum]|uniref:hypothetical protein n=1 Tax=Rhizobium tibeticum TaxID=501024 RepID=UPI002784E047|nr:hypothetical protein [Rhizobium tibeticum]MDP9813605.1 hypothetical protein [Rhizobium tibeticum]